MKKLYLMVSDGPDNDMSVNEVDRSRLLKRGAHEDMPMREYLMEHCIPCVYNAFLDSKAWTDVEKDAAGTILVSVFGQEQYHGKFNAVLVVRVGNTMELRGLNYDGKNKACFVIV